MINSHYQKMKTFDNSALSTSFWEQLQRRGETPALLAIFSNRGVIYGGALRDIVSEQEIKDLDVVIARKFANSFYSQLIALGYTATPNEDNGTILWTKLGNLPIESYVVEDDPDTTCIGPESDPDFDVNLLRWDGKTVIRWTDCGEVESIADAIRNRQATRLGEDVAEHRTAKILARGYSLVGEDPVPVASVYQQPAIFKPRGEFGNDNNRQATELEISNENARRFKENFLRVLHSKEFASSSDANQQEFLREMAKRSYLDVERMNHVIRQYWNPSTPGLPAPVLRPFKT